MSLPPAAVAVVVVIVVMFLPAYFLYRLYTGEVGEGTVPFVIPVHPFAMIKKTCDRNFANSDIGFIRSKKGTLQPRHTVHPD